jgi:tripartite motif-containing protein 71
VAVAPNGNVYVTDSYNHRIQRFTAAGKFLGWWGHSGTGVGEFSVPSGLNNAINGYVYVADTNNHRIQHFTATGSFLGKWGKQGSGKGEFLFPLGVAVNREHDRAYVADSVNNRIQYFKDVDHAVAPTSLGRVRALFR